MSLAGSLRQTPLSVLIRENCREGQTVRINLDHQGEPGAVYISEGQVVHAERGDSSGEEALYEMLAWHEGSFALEPAVTPPTKTIALPWAQLLIEGAKRWYREAGPQPEENSVSDSQLEEAFKTLPQSGAEEMPERDSELLALLQEIPGVVGAVETAPDGTLLAADVPDGKGEREAMLAVLLGGTADQLGDILNLDTFAGGVVSLPSQRLVILKHGESYVGLVLSAQASAALVSRAAAQLLES